MGASKGRLVKHMGHARMGTYAVEQATKQIMFLSIAHVTVLMREPLHQLVPPAEIPTGPSLPGSFSRASASSAEGHRRARTRTPTPTVSQIPGRRSHQRPLPQA
jgi:hypothetical protein